MIISIKHKYEKTVYYCPDFHNAHGMRKQTKQHYEYNNHTQPRDIHFLTQMCKEIYFAAGCFWGAEKYLKLIRGVISTEVGFANGNTPDPTYKEVYTDTTGYAECVHVTYDPQVITVDKLTRIYFKAIDPTSLNKQGEDEGTRYRTGVYYAPDTDAATVELLQKVFKEQEQALEPGQKLAVELLPLKNFYRAEEYHQDYLDKNPTGYCHLTPALFRLAAESN